MYKSQKLLFILASVLFLALAIFISYNAIQGRKVLRSKAVDVPCSTATRPADCPAPRCQWIGDRNGVCSEVTNPVTPGATNCSSATRPDDCPAPACQWVGDRNGSCQAVSTPPTVPPDSGGSGTTNLTPNSIAYIGCSNSWQSVEGYHLVPGNKGLFWPVDRAMYDIGGLTVEAWARTGNWRGFDQMKTRFGNPKAVWVSMCVLEQESKQQTTTITTVETMLNNVRSHAPGVPIYLSPINSYVAPDYCTKVGRNGQAYIENLRDQAVSRGLALRGPELGPLPSSMKIDGCHPNRDGQILLGRDLADFFDRLSVGGITPPVATITTQPTPTDEPIQPTQPPITVPPTGGSVNLIANLKLSFQGITTSRTQNMTVKVTLVGGANRYEKSAEFTVDASGVWSGNVDFGTVQKRSDYYLLVKGPKHVQKRVCDLNPTETRPGTYSCFQGAISVQTSTLVANLSGIKLLVGDLPEQDGVVDSYDVSLVRNIIAKPVGERQAAENIRLADLNLDGVVDSQDYSLVIAALSTRSDEN